MESALLQKVMDYVFEKNPLEFQLPEALRIASKVWFDMNIEFRT